MRRNINAGETFDKSEDSEFEALPRLPGGWKVSNLRGPGLRPSIPPLLLRGKGLIVLATHFLSIEMDLLCLGGANRPILQGHLDA